MLPSQKLQLISLVYGDQVPSPDHTPLRHMNITKAAAKVGVKLQTASKFLIKWLQDGRLDRLSNIKGRRKKVPEDIINMIVSRDKLIEWRHMTMLQRCEQLFHDTKHWNGD